MKKRIVLVLALVAVFLLPGGTGPVLAHGMSGVTGGVSLEPPYWGDYFRVWLEFDVHQSNPSTYEADGVIKGRVYNPTLGWKRLWFDAECVSFGEVDGKPAATLVATIERREGWYPGEPGEHLKWQVVDGGTPGASGDAWSVQWYDPDDWIEYWPADSEPGCSDFEATETLIVDDGNLVIH